MTNEIIIKHEYKTCPRCGAGFECKSGNILQCQCYGIEISESTQQQIGQQFQDCLCRTCLESWCDNPIPYKPAE